MDKRRCAHFSSFLAVIGNNFNVLSFGFVEFLPIELTYNSNNMEASKLTHDETRYIYETNTIGIDKQSLNVDDIIETVNHFHCVDLIIEHAEDKLSEKFIKLLHYTLKTGSSDSRKSWFAVGGYKRVPNEVGGQITTAPEEVSDKMSALLAKYNDIKEKTLFDLIDFHYQFEQIHPFQDGNGRVGRLILFKECLKNNIVPFIINDETKMFYYRGLKEWQREKGFLTDTCLAEQDAFKQYLDYFRLEY